MKNEYQKIISEYVNSMKNNLGDNLQLLLIIGSSSSPKVIKNWSDIDSIVVLKKYNFKVIELIKQISNNFDVKIGTTIYTSNEFINKKIDSKTYYHLYLLENNIIELQYKNDSLDIPQIMIEEVKNQYNYYLRAIIHPYKRMFLYESLSKEQYRKIFKDTYIIMKTILIIDGFVPRNYDEVFHQFYETYNFKYYDYEKFIKDYLSNNENYKNIYEYAKQLLLMIIEKW